jgi:glutamyl-tRNA synthetase
LVQTRVVVLSDGWELLKFLNDDVYAIDPKAAARELTAEAVPVLDSALGALDGIPEWTSASIEEALKGALIDGLGLKPRKAFGPIRVAVTGAAVSPPLYESMELLGRDRSMRRLRDARDGAERNLW